MSNKKAEPQNCLCKSCPNQIICNKHKTFYSKSKSQYVNAEEEARAIAGRSCEDSPASQRTRYF